MRIRGPGLKHYFSLSSLSNEDVEENEAGQMLLVPFIRAVVTSEKVWSYDQRLALLSRQVTAREKHDPAGAVNTYLKDRNLKTYCV